MELAGFRTLPRHPKSLKKKSEWTLDLNHAKYSATDLHLTPKLRQQMKYSLRIAVLIYAHSRRDIPRSLMFLLWSVLLRSYLTLL